MDLMTTDENVRLLADEMCRACCEGAPIQLPLVPTISVLKAVRDNAACRGIMREWMRRLESPDMVGLRSLREFIEKTELEEGALDDLVHDLASQIGSEVNNGGFDEQAKFIVSQLGGAALATVKDAVDEDQGTGNLPNMTEWICPKCESRVQIAAEELAEVGTPHCPQCEETEMTPYEPDPPRSYAEDARDGRFE